MARESRVKGSLQQCLQLPGCCRMGQGHVKGSQSRVPCCCAGRWQKGPQRSGSRGQCGWVSSGRSVVGGGGASAQCCCLEPPWVRPAVGPSIADDVSITAAASVSTCISRYHAPQQPLQGFQRVPPSPTQGIGKLRSRCHLCRAEPPQADVQRVPTNYTPLPGPPLGEVECLQYQ